MEPADHPDVTGRDSFGRGRLSAAANQAARDQTRLQASQDAVASEVIAFQVLQQRAHLAAGADSDPSRIAASLSAREREVISLVALGRSDGDIASDLFISKKTASVHVANIKSKLGAASRVEIAMLAAKLHLAPDGAMPLPEPRAVEGRGTPVVCPFKGLASFDVGDGGYFYGRERVVAELVARLAATTFLAVVGPSGSGKSSVVRAGLVPALRGGVLPGSEQWPLAVMRPGEHPLDSLGRAVRGAMHDADRVGDENPAEEWLDGIPAGGRLVIVVDQLEEAFTVCRDPRERARFMDRLAALARDPSRRALVAVAIRSEFYGRCAEHRDIAALAGMSTVLLGPMTADELTRAIELPARAAGLRMDTTLVPALVTDVLQQPGALPMLSSTLLELWQRREGRALRMDTYRELGGISGAVGRIAETVFGRLSPRDQSIARSIFLRLATVGDTGIAARRRAPIAELVDGHSPDIARVMDVLVDGRLLTVDDGSVEPAHEALLREWPRMRDWLDDDAEARRIRQHLTATAREWSDGGRESGELYRGQRLSSALDWAARRHDEVNEAEREFLAASQEASEADLARQRRANVRLRGLLGAVAVLLVLALTAGTLALRQADEARGLADAARVSADDARSSADDARESATYARVRELAASSRVANLSDPTLGKLLAVSAGDLLPPDLETEAVLHEAWLDDAVLQRIPRPAGRPAGLVAAVDAEGARLAEVWAPGGDEGSLLEVVDVATGQSLWSHSFSTPGVVIDRPFFSLDGSKVLVSLFWVDAEHEPPADVLGVLEFDALTGDQLARLDAGRCGALLTGVSAAGYLAIRVSDATTPTCFGDGNPAYQGAVGRPVDLFEPTTGTWRTVAERNLGDVMVSRDGTVIAYSTPEESAVTVTLATGEVRAQVHAPTAYAQNSGLFRAISADGARALYGDRPPFLVDTSTGKAIRSLHDDQGESWGQAFDLAGDVAFTSGRDAVLRSWNPRGSQSFAVPGIPGGEVLATADGRAIVVEEGGAVTIVNPRPRGEAGEFRTCHGGYPAGSLLTVGHQAFMAGSCWSGDRPFYAIDLTGTPQLSWKLGDAEGQRFAVSSDGAWIARQTQGTLGIEILDGATGKVKRQLEGTCTWDSPSPWDRHLSPGCREFPNPPFPVWAVDLQFSPDASMLVGVDDLGYLIAWDTMTGRIIGTIESRGRTAGVLFTPDGKEILQGTEEGDLVAYSTATWAPTHIATIDDESWITPIAYLDGGRTLLVASGIRDEVGGTILRVDASTLKVTGAKHAHTANLKNAAVSPDGSQIATAAANGFVRVWDADTLALKHEMRVPGQAQGVAFLDETHLAVMPQVGDLLVMILDRGELLAKVRSSLTRGYRPEECAQLGFADPCPTLDELRGGGSVTP